MKFFKYQALSNDFAIADEDACEMGFSSLARILCERKKGAGADGLLIFARDKKSVRFFPTCPTERAGRAVARLP